MKKFKGGQVSDTKLPETVNTINKHDETCMCESCIAAGLDQLVLEGKLQKLRLKSTGEAVWLNADLPVPPDCEAWVDA